MLAEEVSLERSRVNFNRVRKSEMNRTFTISVGAIFSSTLFIAGALAATPGTQASVIAMNQKAKGDAVSITYAYAPKEGTLAIFAADPSQKSSQKPIGETALSIGDHRNISVDLTSQPKPGTNLWAIVEQGKSEKPFKNMDGPAEQSFKVL